MKSFFVVLAVAIFGCAISNALGLDGGSSAFGFFIGWMACMIYEHVEGKETNVNQVQIVKDGQTINIQANGDIKVNS